MRCLSSVSHSVWVIAAVPYILVLKNDQSNFWVLSTKMAQLDVFKNITGGCVENGL